MDALNITEPKAEQGSWSNFQETGTIERRLRRNPDVSSSRETDCYLDVLPTFKGRDLIHLIDKLQSGQKKPIRLLDIGGGAGLADLDLRKEYPVDKLEITVIGNINDIRKDLRKPLRGIFRSSTENELKSNKIRFISTDFSRYDRGEPEEITGGFDIIIASHSLKWIAEKRVNEKPDFFKEGVQDEVKKEMILKVREMLSPNGVALIAPYDQNIEYEIEGLELNHDGVSFSRSE